MPPKTLAILTFTCLLLSQPAAALTLMPQWYRSYTGYWNNPINASAPDCYLTTDGEIYLDCPGFNNPSVECMDDGTGSGSCYWTLTCEYSYKWWDEWGNEHTEYYRDDCFFEPSIWLHGWFDFVWHRTPNRGMDQLILMPDSNGISCDYRPLLPDLRCVNSEGRSDGPYLDGMWSFMVHTPLLASCCNWWHSFAYDGGYYGRHAIGLAEPYSPGNGSPWTCSDGRLDARGGVNSFVMPNAAWVPGDGPLNCGQTATTPQALGLMALHEYRYGYDDAATDPDEDGSTSYDEASTGGSRINAAPSTPETDDDGDGTPNRDEPGSGLEPRHRIQCNGAYGIVSDHGCGGYAYPSGPSPFIQRGPVGTASCVGLGGCTQVWFWDPICSNAMGTAAPNYQICKDTSKRAPSQLTPGTTTQNTATVTDGYGWRYAYTLTGIQDTTVTVTELCPGYPKDSDQDRLHVVALCDRTHTVSFTGDTPTVTPGTYGAPKHVAGDPDDTNPEAPIPTSIIADYDGDGEPTSDELRYSNPADSTSTKDGDDDGDGKSNNLAFSSTNNEPAYVSGQYGVSWPPVCHADLGTSCTQGSPLPIVATPDSKVWVWDGVCQPSPTQQQGRVQACKDRAAPRPSLQGVAYSGNYLHDGYGWRYVANQPSPSGQYYALCPGSPSDGDADGTPLIQVCRYTFTYTAGQVSTTQDPAAPPAATGDPDDSDPKTPINGDVAYGFMEDVQAAAVEAYLATVSLIENATNIVDGFRKDIEEAVGDPNRLPALANQYAETTRANLLALSQRASDSVAQNTTGLGNIVVCAVGHYRTYQDLLIARTREYLEDPTPERLGALQAALAQGSLDAAERVRLCDGPGWIADTATSIVAAIADAAAVTFGRIEDGLAAANDAVGFAANVLGPGGNAAAAIVNQTISYTEHYQQRLEDYAILFTDLASQGIEDLASQSSLDGIISRILLEESGDRGVADVVFFSTNETGAALPGVTINVTRNDRLVATATTDAQGQAVVHLGAEQNYTATATKAGFAAEKKNFRTGWAGTEHEITFSLTPSRESFAISGPLVFGAVALGAILLLFMSTRRRRN